MGRFVNRFTALVIEIENTSLPPIGAVRAGLDRLRCEPWRPWGRGEVLLGNEFDLDHGIF